MRLLLFVACIAGAVASIAPGARACSQCMCGTPFPSDVLGGVVPLQFTYGLEQRYLSKSNALEEDAGDEREREHRVAGFALWRPMNRLALLGRLPYNFKQITESPSGEASSTERSRGIGDAELLGLAGLANRTGNLPVRLALVFGVTAPTGTSDAEDDDGERLDEHLQPGTGAWTGLAGVHLAMTAPAGTWDLSLLGRANAENSRGYRYGNVLLYNAGFISRPLSRLQFVAQVNGRSAKRDRLEDGERGENTGGTVTYVAPGLRWDSGMGLVLEGAVQVPIHQSLFGEQTENTTGRLALSFSP